MPDDDPKTMAEGRLGRLLRGKYRLDRVIGIGGMATVYAATHRNKKRFAIKMLHPELSIHENIRTRFLREGYVANSVDHVGAVSVLDDDVAEDGSAFLVMELLEGSAVDELAATKPGRRLPLGLVLSIGDAILEVLVAAHTKGIVHRDLKPANLFLTHDGRLEVLDFGIARLHDDTASEATAVGAMMGTPAFMAPEQAMGRQEQIDAQTDLWAVGATLFVLAAGTLVHEGENAQQLMVNAATRKARSLASVAEEVPKAVTEVIDRALAFEKAERWGSVREMREALRKACLEATGSPVGALPKTKRVTGLEDTVAPGDSGVVSGSSGAAFEPTVDAGSAGRGGGPLPQSTAGAVARTKGDAPLPARRRRPWRSIGSGLLACLVVAGGVAGYRMARAPRVHYCLRIEDTLDGPRCLFEVKSNILGKRRKPIARVTERGGHAVLVEYVNFAGVVDGSDDLSGSPTFSRMDVIRDDSGRVRELISYDRFGVILEWQKWFEGGRRIDFVDIDGKTARHRDGGRITTERVDYDALGHPKRQLYFGPTGRPRRRANGAYGLEFEYGKTPGVRTKETSLGADGAAAPQSSGVTFIRYADDGLPWGGPSLFDADDHPTALDRGHSTHVSHNDYEDTGGSGWGIHGEPATSLRQSFHEARLVWEPTKRTVEALVLDEHGRPQSVRGLWFTALRASFDERGREVTEEFLDGQGNRVVGAMGAATYRQSYDQQGHVIGAEVLDPTGAPVQSLDGWARRDSKRDAHDDELEARHYDEGGAPGVMEGRRSDRPPDIRRA